MHSEITIITKDKLVPTETVLCIRVPVYTSILLLAEVEMKACLWDHIGYINGRHDNVFCAKILLARRSQ